jgi:hypothetical protein
MAYRHHAASACPARGMGEGCPRHRRTHVPWGNDHYHPCIGRGCSDVQPIRSEAVAQVRQWVDVRSEPSYPVAYAGDLHPTTASTSITTEMLTGTSPPPPSAAARDAAD